MFAKIWPKIGMFILIVACLFNIVIKIVTKISMQEELSSLAESVREEQKEEKN